MPCTWSLKIKNVLSFYRLVGNFMAVAVDLVSLIVYSQFKKCGILKLYHLIKKLRDRFKRLNDRKIWFFIIKILILYKGKVCH